MSDLRTSTTWRAHTDALKEAGWERVDTGFYRHGETGHGYYPFEGIVHQGKATELWRIYAEKGEMPSAYVPHRTRTWILADDPKPGTRAVEVSDND